VMAGSNVDGGAPSDFIAGNDGEAPLSNLPALALERGGSTQSGRSSRLTI